MIDTIPRIEAAEVKRRLDRGEPIVFFDTRNPTAWSEAADQIPGAIRVPKDAVEQHMSSIPPGALVVTYCT